jgi:hypothetical protein
MASRQVRLGERAQILPAGEASTCGIGDTGAKKEEYASTLRNFRLCLGITCAWEGDGYMADQSERHYNDIDWVVNHLYASGVYAGLQTFDGGIRVWICDRHYCQPAVLPPSAAFLTALADGSRKVAREVVRNVHHSSTRYGNARCFVIQGVGTGSS